jgi:hypothetical protein
LYEKSDSHSLCLRFGDITRESDEQDVSIAAPEGSDFANTTEYHHLAVEYTVVLKKEIAKIEPLNKESGEVNLKEVKWLGKCRTGAAICHVRGLQPAQRYWFYVETVSWCMAAENHSTQVKMSWKKLRRRSVRFLVLSNSRNK